MNARPKTKESRSGDHRISGWQETKAAVAATMLGSLSAGRRRLICGMQRHPFSRIENLGVSGGDPVFGPSTRWIAETKLGAADAVRPEVRLSDFALKREHTELFEQFDAIGSGNILTLEVRAGLPFRIIRQVVD